MLLTVKWHQGVPAQRREAEQRQRYVAQERIAREQRDDLISARHAKMRAVAAFEARDVAAEQRNRSAVRRNLAGDQVEQRRLAGAVRADDQSAFSRCDREGDIRSDVQAAERFAQGADGERAHGFGPASGICTAVALSGRTARQAERARRAAPGTRPSGMNTTMATKIAPSRKFQRST